MPRSIVFAALLATALAACARNPAPVAPPAPETSVDSLKSAFVPYCGPVWSVGKQGYVYIPCPPGSTYPGAL
jgi:hypothetical protein